MFTVSFQKKHRRIIIANCPTKHITQSCLPCWVDVQFGLFHGDERTMLGCDGSNNDWEDL